MNEAVRSGAVARPAAYTVSNHTVNRSLNESTVTLAQLAQVLGTLLKDLQANGPLQ